jgi:predicted  nucleic acid-binding Zn-ribbon protein
MGRQRIFRDSSHREGSDGSGDKKGNGSGDKREKKDNIIKEVDLERRERRNAEGLRAQRTAILDRIRDVDARSLRLEERDVHIQNQLDRLADESPRYDQLTDQDRAKFDNRLRNYERARTRYNEKAASINHAIGYVVGNINNYNNNVQSHMGTLRNTKNAVNEIPREDYPERVIPYPAFHEFRMSLQDEEE